MNAQTSNETAGAPAAAARKLSKTKAWRVLRVVEKAKEL